ncbi:MAG: hypothetical protein ACRDLF_06435 [Solirubrobacteraceae bacterium]
MSAFKSPLAGLVSLCALAAMSAVLPSAAVGEECPNAAFRTGPSTHLPDCRAYELVSPPYKATGVVKLLGSSPDGTSLTLDVSQGLPGLEGDPNLLGGIYPGAFYTTQRTASGWVTVGDELPASEYVPFKLDGFSDGAGVSLDNQTRVWMARGRWQADNGIDFFKRGPDRSIVDVGPALPPTTPSGIPEFLGADASLRSVGSSADASRQFFKLGANFWSFDKTEEFKFGFLVTKSLYEYIGAGNTTPMLVGVDNSGKQISQCGVTIGSASYFSHNAVSTDGNVVFFTALQQSYGCKGSAPPAAELFARIDNGLAGAHTVAISEPSKEDCSACDTEAGVLADAQFRGASEDGSKVFFSTTQPLLGGDSSSNIYEYDFGAPAGARVVRVSGGDSTVSSPTADVLPGDGNENLWVQVSEDGSHVYFFANGVLTKTPNGQGESAEAGAANLYVFERDAGYPAGRIAFVARLSPEDLAGFYGKAFRSNVTPDGRFLVFTSRRDLTPDDTSTAMQVFEYDAQSGALVRVSIGQNGYNDNGNTGVADASIVSPTYEVTYESSMYWSHLSVSADGSRVFFQSTAGLTPQAFDRKVVEEIPQEGAPPIPVYANNVYEYHAGQVSLISDGQDISTPRGGSAVRLLGTDASGADVFFTTGDRLVGQDTDDNLDIYDARLDGGFPAPAVLPSCLGEACQGALSGAPTLLSPGSEFQAGANPPLAGEPAGKPMRKAKRPKPKRKQARGHAGRRGRKAKKAAVGGRVEWKAGR